MTQCSACGLCKTSQVNCLRGEGPVPCKVMIIGDAPGGQEERFKRPFVGDTGQLLDEEFIPILGLKRSEVYVTNAVRCRPPENRTPTTDEIECCKQHVFAEIFKVQPKLIILLGAVAIKSVLGLDGIEKHRGQFYTITGVTAIAFPTYHPGKLWQAWESYDMIRMDFRKAALALTDQPLVTEGEYKVCTTVDEVLVLKDQLLALSKFSFDTETTSLDHQTGKILCCSFSDEPSKGYTVPLLGRYGLPYWQDEKQLQIVEDAIAEVLASDVPVIMQNGSFDMLFCWMKGWEVKNFTFDTMQAAHLVDENLPCSLDTLISLYTTMPNYSKELADSYTEQKKLRKKAISSAKKCQADVLNFPVELLNCEENYSIIPTDILWKYAAQDADATMRVAEVLKQRLTEENLWGTFNDVTMPMVPFVALLQWNGILVDQNKLMELQCVAESEVAASQEKLKQHLSIEANNGQVYDVNVGSPKQLKAVLVDVLKWPVVSETKTGNPSFDADAMEIYSNAPYNKPAASTIIEIKKHKKRISDFLAGSDRKSGVLKHISDTDGRVHPSFKLHGTRTGRLSASDPAIHNVPRGEIRNCYIPPNGQWWIEADYSQLELRILAALSGDPQLTQWFADGLDVHRMVAAEVLGKSPDAVTSEERVDYGKGINFGIIYGKREWSLAQDLSVSFDEARAFLQRYFQRLPKVKPFFEGILREVYSTGNVRTAMGRVRHFHGAPLYKRAQARSTNPNPELERKLADIERQAYNDPIQSPGSDILCKACIRLQSRMQPFKSLIVHHHHDALHLNCPPDEMVEVCTIVKEEMERPVPEFEDYIFPVDFKVCNAWYDENKETTQWLMDQLK